jgi:ABC-type uncharacterized transport system auxiliary subunit
MKSGHMNRTCLLLTILGLAIALSGCGQEAKDAETVAVDTMNQPQSPVESDSGSLLVAVPDSTSSPQPSRIPRAKPDTGSIGAVAMPNAGIDSLEISLQQAIDQLDSMIIPAEKPAGKK